MDSRLKAELRRLEQDLHAADARGAARVGNCANCRHYKPVSELRMTGAYCRHPLVGDVYVDAETGATSLKPYKMKDWAFGGMNIPTKCGEERALFTPKLTLLDRLVLWFTGE